MWNRVPKLRRPPFILHHTIAYPMASTHPSPNRLPGEETPARRTGRFTTTLRALPRACCNRKELVHCTREPTRIFDEREMPYPRQDDQAGGRKRVA